MRLLTDTGRTVPQLQEFIGDDNSNLPPFAILSHTWEDDEVSLQDLSDPSKCINQRGFLKIQSTCNLAAQNGFKYTWIDTCCIDKQASAELSEAINSMFYWYEKAAVCYVYLSDLLTAEDDADAAPNLESALKECRWFGRGWTLQELIAPANVRFYDRNWTYVGDKSTLSETISSITNIPVGLLRRERQLSDFSVACRMSWASKRKTTRVEDMAYCLLGIFDVNMPLIYGERENSFSRLQQQVLQATGDLSILAWADQHPATREYSALLAESPSQFAWCSGIQIKPHMSASRGLRVTPLEIELRTGLMHRFDGSGLWFVLDLFSSLGDNSVGVSLRRYRGSEYVRWRPDSLLLFRPCEIPRALESCWIAPTDDGTSSSNTPEEHWMFQRPTKTISLPSKLPPSLVRESAIPDFRLDNRHSAVRLRWGQSFAPGGLFTFSIPEYWPESHWDPRTEVFSCAESVGTGPTGWACWVFQVQTNIPCQGRPITAFFVTCLFWNSEKYTTTIVVARDLLVANIMRFNLGRVKFEDWMEVSVLFTDILGLNTEDRYEDGEDIVVGTTEETEVVLRCVSEKTLVSEICPNPMVTLTIDGEVRDKARTDKGVQTRPRSIHDWTEPY